ncbi:hypothetical protein DYE48_06595 [Halobacillus trueperi]|uniref:Uncharacterized protein n=1 Tax=Halobacillus trueperi TaxID=156205 RepID=A0A3E0JAF8_9BACI|nr:hypothetical protein DYE48_06595 [Halobacillus trueperi]
MGERRASSDCVLRDLAYLLLPRESRSFPTTPFHEDEKRTPLLWEGAFHYSGVISIKRTISSFSHVITICIKAAYSGYGFEILIWQRGGGEWRDSCGTKVHGETPQDAVRGGSPHSRGKRAIPRSPDPHNKHLETESSTIGSLSVIGIF